MKGLVCCVVLSLSLGGVAIAHQGVMDSQVKAWMHAMGEAGKASKVLGSMTRGAADYDPEAAQEARELLITVAADIPALFEVPRHDPVSEALPTIWQDYSDFTEKAEAMRIAAEALDVSSPEGLQQGLRNLGRSCSGCHRDYRE
ncbi:c-type cytochrome [Cognatishimia maritima]|uniref:Cytochrome c556 n=1 Tax=Cognatishimia maritima TaxID=870908 RepID=A0A1M5NJY2_9RHOB|nr:cytochrome c [Cognatishimia maritima]SHG89253.1 Cytochrome c556 [Cognatishimia maritima]